MSQAYGRLPIEREDPRAANRELSAMIDDLEGASFGAEILDSSADVEDDGFLTVRGLDNGGCYAGLEFFGGDPSLND